MMESTVVLELTDCCDDYDYYADEIDLDQIINQKEVLDLRSCPFIEDIKDLAKKCITNFFLERDHYNGGEISLTEITHEKNLFVLIDATISSAIRVAYDGMKNAHWIDKTPPQEGVPGGDVRLLLSILNECSNLGVPKYFAGGIALLCLQYCEGVEIPYENIEVYLQEEAGCDEEYCEENSDNWYVEYRDENGNLIEDHNPSKEVLMNAVEEEKFSINDFVVDYGLPK